MTRCKHHMIFCRQVHISEAVTTRRMEVPMFLLFLCIQLCIGLESGHGLECNLPSNSWCDSKATARLCGVEAQCEQHIWSKMALKKTGAPLVNFTLYYESMCPDCQRFFKKQLWPAYKKIGNIMNLTLVPYGNAEEKWKTDHWEFNCQHGEQECIGNLIETCAIFLIKDIKQYMPFIHCIEEAGSYPRISAPLCAKKYKLEYSSILKCANGSMGNMLEHQMAVQTDKLDPPHQYVPWVTLNGVHTEKIQDKAEDELVELICDAYQGEKPEACDDVKTTKSRCFKGL